MKKIGVVTTSRADFSCYLPVLRAIDLEESLELLIAASGSHLLPEFGRTITHIEAEGFHPTPVAEPSGPVRTPTDVTRAMGEAVAGFGGFFAQSDPDVVMVLGDRYEMHAAALACLPLLIPVAHLHGGELTQGAIDDALRHSITKLSHLHFVATDDYGRRVAQMGEEPWRITVTGAPALDSLSSIDLLSPEQLASDLGLPPDIAPLLVTFHPETLHPDKVEAEVSELLDALERVNRSIVFTSPGADVGSLEIKEMVEKFVSKVDRAVAFDSLGTETYFSLMAACAAMVGNSSSGIIEASSFGTPVVNVGDRQEGRIRGPNVIDVPIDTEAILRAIDRAINDEFRQEIGTHTNPYFKGGASELILGCLMETDLSSEELIQKRFFDLKGG